MSGVAPDQLEIGRRRVAEAFDGMPTYPVFYEGKEVGVVFRFEGKWGWEHRPYGGGHGVYAKNKQQAARGLVTGECPCHEGEQA